MRKLTLILAAALCMLPPPSFAGERVLRDDSGNSIRLIDSPCVHGGTLAQLKPEFRDKFKKADVTMNGERVYGCWIEDEDGDYFVLLENGQSSAFFRSSFKETPTI